MKPPPKWPRWEFDRSPGVAECRFGGLHYTVRILSYGERGYLVKFDRAPHSRGPWEVLATSAFLPYEEARALARDYRDRLDVHAVLAVL